MPKRSSRSRPDSLTSLSEPTGSASLAIAMSGASLTVAGAVPGVRSPDRLQPGAGLLVAQGAVDAGVVEGARIQAERGRGLVVTAQVGVEHRGIVGRDRAADARSHEAGQRVVGKGGDSSRAEVRER